MPTTNWKAAVSKVNAEAFVLPDGWTSKEDLAKELECSEDRVDDALRPGLKSGRFVKQQHKVWCERLGRCTLVVAYHDTAMDEQSAKPEPDAAQMQSLRAQGKEYAEIGNLYGLTADAVRARLKRASASGLSASR